MIEGMLVQETRMRAGVARRMTESKQQVPHFYVQTEVAVDEARAFVARAAADTGRRITLTALLVRATALTLRRHAAFNAVWTPDGLLRAEPVNVGVAVALDDGLVAPALLGADRLDLSTTAARIADLSERARTARIRPAELSGATFTLSNLGMFDVTAFTAIITPPQIATLATARPVERVALIEGTPVAAQVMTITLSADHRAVDGRDAAEFVATFKSLVEHPARLGRPVEVPA